MADTTLWADFRASLPADTDPITALLMFGAECPGAQVPAMVRRRACVLVHPGSPHWIGGTVRQARDALIRALLDRGLTRGQVHGLLPEDVRCGRHWSVAGVLLGTRSDPSDCPACVLGRWLAVVDGFDFAGVRSALGAELALSSVTGHACRNSARLVRWWDAPALIVPVDSAGRLSDQPLSVRSVGAGAGNDRKRTAQSRLLRWPQQRRPGAPARSLVETIRERARTSQDIDELWDRFETAGDTWSRRVSSAQLG